MAKRRFVKIFICLLAVILAGGIYSYANKTADPLLLSVSAISEPYEMTEVYKSSKFYSHLASLDLSGDEARDVLAIAMSQVGYHEGNSDADMHGGSTSGSRDYVEYNVLSGKWDNGQGNGESYGYYWCASFVNWCLRLAGVSEGASGSEISCQRWYYDCKTLGIFNAKGGYFPSSGDLIFFRDNGSSVASTHVGLVRYCDGTYVYTVEGNTSNGNEYSSNGEYVALKKHELKSKYIVGYASPKYESNNTACAVDYSGGFLSLGQYISDKELELFADKELAASSQAVLPAFTLFSVTEISDGVMKAEYGGNAGYISCDAAIHQLTTSEDIYMTKYEDESGAPMFFPQYGRAGDQRPIYTNKLGRENSGFVGWRVTEMPDTVLSPGESLPDGAADVTLIPVYDDNYYVVSFKLSDGTLISQSHGYYGTEYETPIPEAPEGQIFTGWDAEPDGVIRGDASYTAAFVPVGELESETISTPEQNTLGCTSNLSGTALLFPSISLCLSAFLVVKRKK